VFEEMEVLKSPRTYQNPPEEAWKRVKIRSDRSDVLAILKTLAAWREREAVRRDIPRGRVMKDETLSDIALYKPRELESLLQIRSLPSDVAKGKVGAQILEMVNRTLDAPRETWPKAERKEPFPKNAQGTLEMLKMLLRINCAEADVAAKLVADSDDLERLAVEDKPDIHAMQGWRFEVFGKDALAMKAGEIGLSLNKGRIHKTKL
jgi:ribonuclease D